MKEKRMWLMNMGMIHRIRDEHIIIRDGKVFWKCSVRLIVGVRLRLGLGLGLKRSRIVIRTQSNRREIQIQIPIHRNGVALALDVSNTIEVASGEGVEVLLKVFQQFFYQDDAGCGYRRNEPATYCLCR